MSISLKTNVGRLRLLAILEGISLLLLVFVAVPVKYLFDFPDMVKALGPIHGVLFVLFILNTINVGIAQRWEFKSVTWKVLLACLIPFGTFYIDHRILSKIEK